MRPWTRTSTHLNHLLNALNSLNKPDISFSRSNMALVASSCSKLLTWLFWPWRSSPRGELTWSFTLALCAAPAILKHDFSLLCDFALKRSRDGPSGLSPCMPPFWLQWGKEKELGGSVSLLFFVELRDSCDLDRLRPLNMSLKWEVKRLSDSSVLSWVLFSFEESQLEADRSSISVSSSSSGVSEGESYEITIAGIEASGTSLPFSVEAAAVSEGRAVDSGCRNGVMMSLGASVCGLELCRENKAISLWQQTLRHQPHRAANTSRELIHQYICSARLHSTV